MPMTIRAGMVRGHVQNQQGFDLCFVQSQRVANGSKQRCAWFKPDKERDKESHPREMKNFHLSREGQQVKTVVRVHDSGTSK